MDKKYTLLTIFLFVFANSGMAQWRTIEKFNRVNFDIENDNFAKQHRPLDGAKVKMLPFSIDDQFGFVANTPQREELIPPSFANVYTVYEEGAIVQKEDGFGLISPENKWLFPPYFDNINKAQQVYHGLYSAIDTVSDEIFIQNVYLDELGQLLFKEAAHDQKSFNPVDTIAWFRYGRKYRIRGISGHLWKEFDYDENRKFIGIANNLLLFTELESVETRRYRYMGYDAHGKLVFQLVCDGYIENLVQLSPNLFIYTEDGFYYEFCDASGKDLPFVYSDNYLKSREYYRYYRGLYQDYYPVRNERGAEMGLMARDGRMILDLEYSFVEEVRNDMVFCIQLAVNYGQFLSLEGEVIVDKVSTEHDLLMRHDFFRRPIAFDDGLMVGVGQIRPPEGEYMDADDSIFGSKWLYRYYYDQRKNVSIKLEADVILAGPFREGLAPVIDRNKNLGFINKKGEMVIEPAYDLVVHGGMTPYAILPEFIGGFAYIPSHHIYIDKEGKALTKHTEKFDFSGQWMEVRTEDTKILIGQQFPSLEFHFEKTGIVKLREHDNPQSKLLTGRFILQDSLLILNADDDTYPFRHYLSEDKFVIEKHTEEELILRTHIQANIPSTRHYFLSKEKFLTFSKEDIRSKYAFTSTDSLKLAQRNAERQALKALRKNDRYNPIWPGGNKSFMAYMKENLVYPEDHSRFMIVKVYFDVELDGSTSNVKIHYNQDDAYTRSAIRFVKGMKDWMPQIKDGQPKKSTYAIEIRFEYPRK